MYRKRETAQIWGQEKFFKIFRKEVMEKHQCLTCSSGEKLCVLQFQRATQLEILCRLIEILYIQHNYEPSIIWHKTEPAQSLKKDSEYPDCDHLGMEMSQECSVSSKFSGGGQTGDQEQSRTPEIIVLGTRNDG